MIVDAEGLVLGRVCCFVAKQALLGESVIVINAEKAMLSGNKEMILRKEFRWLEVRNLGSPLKGPNHEKRPDKYVRRAIRGMLPWHKFRGRDAFARVMVYMGTPAEEIKKVHNLDIKSAKIEKLESQRKKVSGLSVAEVCKAIGGKF
jgi:large subunit ribosomal protein L13